MYDSDDSAFVAKLLLAMWKTNLMEPQEIKKVSRDIAFEHGVYPHHWIRSWSKWRHLGL